MTGSRALAPAVGTKKPFSSDAWLAAFVALVLPVLLCGAHLGSVARLSYPVSAFLLAGWLYKKGSPWYVGFTVWLFCAAPLVRRLVDEQGAFDPSSPVLLAPYVACSFAGLAFFSFVGRRPAIEARSFLVIIACIGYGLILAFANGRFLSGLIDAMKWSAGPLFALHTLLNAADAKATHRAIGVALLVALPPMAIYGIFQYFAPAKWDVDWLTNIQLLDPGLASIGQPIPYGLRVFSTMNSPGSFAALVSVGILVALQRPTAISLPLVALMALALLLTQYRAVWGGTLLGVAYLAFSRSPGTRFRILLSFGAVIMLMTSSALVPQLRQAISQRINTIGNLQADRSGEDRMHQYEEFLSDDSGDIVLGAGLAIDGLSRKLDGKMSAVIDSGIIVVFTALGIVFGTLLLLGLASAVGLSFSRYAGRSPPIIMYRAVAIASFCQLPFGAVFVGESGFCVWLFLGLAAAQAHLGRQAARDAATSAGTRFTATATFARGALRGA